jgi:hypothetical protein
VWLCGGHRPCDALNSAASSADQSGRLEHSCVDLQMLTNGPLDRRTDGGRPTGLPLLVGAPALILAIPALTRDWIMARSNSEKTPNI